MDIKTAPLTWTYTPEFNDNKKAEKPFTVELRQLTCREKDECLVVEDDRLTVNRTKTVKYCVVKINDLSVGGVPIVTAKDLIDGPDVLFPLFVELWVESRRGLELPGDDIKN